ncbi:MAG: 1,4-dihydroxy-6-naphthoate synthase [Nitrospirae bacterium]|nr:1,4-dihydroxy-6-naphthoate synthase [Nitrospirota bacterium]
MKCLNVGYSPCPNDTYVFYALMNGKLDTGGLCFKEKIEDVETLNRAALKGELEITKLSAYAFGVVNDKYEMLDAGGAMGYGCGPLVVTRNPMPDKSMPNNTMPEIAGAGFDISRLRGKRIAIPGIHTTAYLLLRLCDPVLGETAVPMPFNEIMGAVRAGEVDAGLIIHESRFTYASYGLVQAIDLGKWWEGQTGLPIPLGCIAARRDIGSTVASRTSDLIRESLLYARGNEEEALAYARRYCQELSEDVIRSHIGLYVNDFTLGAGPEGRKAVDALLRMARHKGILE